MDGGEGGERGLGLGIENEKEEDEIVISLVTSAFV